MNTPTGSGKTLASIKLALERAIALGKKRIIYVIPYNSIIDQTAKTFEKIFGSHATILRHQSSFDILSQSAEGQEPISLKQAAENWDAQIILTTAVQFFESIYSNKRSKLRKLHNMADSILIFDEAHLMPDSYLQPCLSAISHITKFLNSEAILLTATMPDYTHLFHDLSDLDADIVELVSNKGDFEIFNKCKINWLNTISDEFLLQHCYDAPSSLIIVNKRATAVEIYRAISVGRKFHLSTHMTALDRERTIEQIKCELRELELDYPRLENVPPERRITVVSTSLIEAGVDLDFFTVYRELWGLDSILQCAGRCNREGKRDTAQAYVFRREADSGKAISDAAEITKGLLSEFEDITLPACIEQYYQRLLWVRRDELRSHSLEVGSNPTRIPFKTYAEQFELISSNAVNVVVIQDERSRELVEKMRQTGHVSSRALQYYSFSVYSYELNMLMAQGAIETIEGIYVLSNNDYYTQEYGIRFEGHDYYI